VEVVVDERPVERGVQANEYRLCVSTNDSRDPFAELAHRHGWLEPVLLESIQREPGNLERLRIGLARVTGFSSRKNV
jgi:hypothetical protein